ncbi:MAG: hypothetical protein FWE13_03145 [Firmicutes bacterium]|nr:hypothetical protein [Bacillota bacterium]
MKKKIISILCISILSIMAILFIGCIDDRPINPICCFDGANVIRSNEVESYWVIPFEERSANLAIANQLHNQHTARYQAMDEFSGIWFCRYGHLNIALTRLPANRDRVSGIIYNHHRFNYGFLEEIMGALSELFGDYSLSSMAISQRRNFVEVELLSDGEDACNYIRQIVAHLQAQQLWERDAVLFIIGSPKIVLD